MPPPRHVELENGGWLGPKGPRVPETWKVRGPRWADWRRRVVSPHPLQAAGAPSRRVISLLNVMSALCSRTVQLRLVKPFLARCLAAGKPSRAGALRSLTGLRLPTGRASSQSRGGCDSLGAMSLAELNLSPRGFDFCALILFFHTTTVFQNHWESESPLPAGDLGWHRAVGRARREPTLWSGSRRSQRGGAGGRVTGRGRSTARTPFPTARRAPSQPRRDPHITATSAPARPQLQLRAPEKRLGGSCGRATTLQPRPL